MRKNVLIILMTILLLGFFSFFYFSFKGLFIFVALLVVFEIISFLTVSVLRKRSTLIITTKDEKPELSREGLIKFFKHGYDPELGWVRKPNTHKEEQGQKGITSYSINNKGARTNPKHEHLPISISCFGASFAFSRQVNDDETWGWFLSELTKTNVLNFGVGNYGLDQIFLHLKREFPKNRTNIVIIGIIPSTIIRTLSVWKHYHDYGNTFGFKPTFVIKDDKLKLIPNPIDNENKFSYYQDFLPQIQKYDYFYKNKFKKEILEFPYFISILRNPLPRIAVFLLALFSPNKKRGKKQNKEGNKERNEEGNKKLVDKPSTILNLLRSLNLRFNSPLGASFYKKKYVIDLFTKIIEEFIKFGKEENFIPILLFMPQKEDLIYIRYKSNYYKSFIEKISAKLHTIDLTESFIDKDLDQLYTDDSKYGGHFSKSGNEAIANGIYKKLKEWDLLEKVQFNN